MKTSIREDLEKLKNFLTMERWCKGANARRDSWPIPAGTADNTCQFCMLGAMLYLGGSLTSDETVNHLNDVVIKRGYSDIPDFNDELTVSHADVVSVLDEAILTAPN